MNVASRSDRDGTLPGESIPLGTESGQGGDGGSGSGSDSGSGEYSVPLAEIVERLRLMLVAGGHLDLDVIEVTTSDVNRPGLELSGYLDYVAADRLQIIGWKETAYLAAMAPEVREERLERYFALGFPALIVARGLHVMPDMVQAATRHDVPILVTQQDTSGFAGALTWFLTHALAPRTEIAAALVDVHGEGVLIFGKTGMGISETALELVRRGHRLISDDRVEVRRISGDHLRGRPPADVGHIIDIPGVGKVDVEELFGIGSIRTDGRVTVAVHTELRDPNKEYERVGIIEQMMEVFGVPLATVVIPVQPGRNLAVIIEAVALTHRQRTLGYVAAAELVGGT